MRVVGVIPARWASQRFPGKPLAKIMGRSMITRTLERSLLCDSLDDVFVATDDDRIKDEVVKYGGKVLMTPVSLNSGTDRVLAAASQLQCDSDDILVNIQGDEPFINPVHVDSLVQSMIEDANCNMSTIAVEEPVPLVNDTNTVKVVCLPNRNALYFSRSLIPYPRFGDNPMYLRHIGLYSFRYRFLKIFAALTPSSLEAIEGLEQLRVIEAGYSIRVVQVQGPVQPGVDTPEQLENLSSYISSNSVL